MKALNHATLLCLLFAAGCASLGNPFTAMTPDFETVPRAALEEMARAVENAVAGGKKDQAFAAVEGVSMANAGVLQAIRTRAIRRAQLAGLLASGHVFETRGGLIKIQANAAYKNATTRGERDRNAKLVQWENQDRWALYEGLLDENHWGARALSAVQSVFFDARLACLAPGEHYEASDGQPVAKVR